MVNDQLRLKYEPLSFADLVAADAAITESDPEPNALRQFLRDLAPDNTLAVLEPCDAAV